MNCLWGKLTERPNRPQKKLTSALQELYSSLAAADIEVCSMQFASEIIVWIAWRNADVFSVPNLPHTNDVIGSFVTAGAPIPLYLDRLDEIALYSGTDSFIYVQSIDQP
jgi:hypothetical protein